MNRTPLVTFKRTSLLEGNHSVEVSVFDMDEYFNIFSYVGAMHSSSSNIFTTDTRYAEVRRAVSTGDAEQVAQCVNNILASNEMAVLQLL